MVIAPDGNNLDLLMNVPLTVTAELGTAKMLVRDILKLGPVTVLKKPLQVEQLNQTLRIMGHKATAKAA